MALEFKHWVSDGTAAGTFALSSGTAVGRVGEFQGRAVFTDSTNQVWTTNGTAAGTTLLTAAGANTFSGSLFTDTFLTIVTPFTRALPMQLAVPNSSSSTEPCRSAIKLFPKTKPSELRLVYSTPLDR